MSARPLLLVLTFCLIAAPIGAQETPTAVPDSSAFERPPGVPSARGAMIRSLIVPGWGQAASRAYLRGGVFFVVQSGSWFMLGKTLAKLNEAREIEGRRIGVLRDSLFLLAEEDELLAQRLSEPGAFEAIADTTAAVVSIRELVGSREQQREDWVAQVIFWTLAGAVDAYVSAQLVDFPGEVDLTPGRDGGADLRFTLPIGRVHR